jgi:ribosome biogenesis GTPase
MEAPPRCRSSLPLGPDPTECYYARSRGGIPTRLPHREHPLATKSIRSRQNGDPRLPSAPRRAGKPGRVVETAGRRVLVADVEGTRMCFLGGHRALVGDTVTWEDAPGEGGKIICVDPRETVLRRIDPRGDEQLLAANLRGVLVVASMSDPPFHGPLIDRYIVAAEADDLEVGIVLTKVDTGTSARVEAEIDARAALGIPVLRTSATDGVGLEDVRAFLNDHPGPWALVGHSGVGKTSLIQALLPSNDVGPIGSISEYWGAGKHTTTRTRLFRVEPHGEIVDSPGIRGFIPALLDPEVVRDHFPGVETVLCHYRDCLHRVGEEGCKAEGQVSPLLLESYRSLVAETESIRARARP